MHSQPILSRLLKNNWGLFPFLIGLVSGLYFITLQILGPSFSYFPGDLGDGRLNVYFLENAYRYFSGESGSFWHAPFMYPEPNVIALSDNLLGSAPLYSFFRMLGMDTFTSYQWWIVLLAVLNYATSYLFLRKLFRNNYAAVLGAMVFAFSMALQSQMTHAQTFPRYAIPLAFLMAIKFKEELHPKYFFFTLLFVVYQIYCGIYLGFMLAIPIAIMLIIILWRDLSTGKLLKDRKWLIRMAGGLVSNIILVLPLMLPYMYRNKAATLNYYREILDTVPSIKSYFFSQHGSLVWDFLSKTATEYPAWWDHQLFAGGIATVSILIFAGFQIKKLIKNGFRPEKGSILDYLLISGIISKILYLRAGRISIYFLVFILPGFSSMRSITRIINIELIFFAIACAYVVSLILKRKNWKSLLLFLVFTGIFIGDNYFKEGKSYRTEKSLALERTEPLIKLLDKLPDGTVISYEPDLVEDVSMHYHIDAMLASQACNLVAVNGYSATCPHDFGPFWRNIDAASRTHWLSKSKKSFDTLYVINSVNEYQKISWSEVEDYKDPEPSYAEKLKKKIEYIRSDKEWMKHIEEKASERQISVDSMLLLDAAWVLENE